jgi:chaperonin GroES
MNIRPLHDRVLIKRVEEETKSPGGIVLPGAPPRSPRAARCMAVGRGKLLENGDVRPLDVKVGDLVLFGKYSGSEVKVDGEDLIVMREDEIMAIIEK